MNDGCQNTAAVLQNFIADCSRFQEVEGSVSLSKGVTTDEFLSPNQVKKERQQRSFGLLSSSIRTSRRPRRSLTIATRSAFVRRG